MLIENIHPTTLDGVKSLAAQLRKDQGVKHVEALNLAARAANCENFQHARRVLPTRGEELPRFYVLLTIYWLDKKQGHRCGRETLRVELTKSVLDLCSKSLLRHVRGFGNLRMVAADHFVCDDVADTQSHARERLCTAERSLRFIEHTGLQPAPKYQKKHPVGGKGGKLPGADHDTSWIDPATGTFILIDEPYSGADERAERAAWQDRTGWRITKTSWPGMYNPYSCALYVVVDGKAAYDTDPLVQKINAMPMPLVEENWPGESGSSWETFVSPLAKTTQDKRRARCKGTVYPTSTRTTVPYSFNLGIQQRRRPAAEMGVLQHKEAGRILKAVLNSGDISGGAFERLNKVRSTLEDWLSLEIDRKQLDGREFFEVYYSSATGDEPYHIRAKSRSSLLGMLASLKKMLKGAYPDCAPLRQQLHRIDMSTSSIKSMKE